MSNHYNRKNLTGKKFGRLLVLEETEKPKNFTNPFVYWLCLCDCGIIKAVCSRHLISGGTKSCGCYRNEIKKSHGMCKKSTNG